MDICAIIRSPRLVDRRNHRPSSLNGEVLELGDDALRHNRVQPRGGLVHIEKGRLKWQELVLELHESA